MQYDFKKDWAQPFRNNAERLFSSVVGNKLDYLEIGTYEGRSVCWMMDNILTHRECRIVCVDLKFQDEAWNNLSIANARYPNRKIETYEGDSKIILPTISGKFDIIYVDGDHSAYPALCDIIFAWKLCKSNGVILIDDFISKDNGNRVSIAVEAFKMCVNNSDYQILVENEQFGILKK